jgi:hypothetical protein
MEVGLKFWRSGGTSFEGCAEAFFLNLSTGISRILIQSTRSLRFTPQLIMNTNGVPATL